MLEEPRPNTAKSRYEKLSRRREVVLDRARVCSKYTLPYLIPPEGLSESSKLATPYSSIASQGVNNLASKIMLALFPPTDSFFRLSPGPQLKKDMDEKLADSTDDNVQSALDQELQKVEDIANDTLETASNRPSLYEAIRHLIVGGNSLLDERSGSGNIKNHGLDQYAVARDGEGQPIEIILKESVDIDGLDEAHREQLSDEQKQPGEKEDDLDLYTHAHLEGQRWHMYQEARGVILNGTEEEFKIDALPLIPLRYNRIDGEDYGRGLCEEILGDIISAEMLSKALVDAAAASSKVLYFRKPGSGIRLSELQRAQSGEMLDGDADMIGTLQVDKLSDFNFARATLEEIKQSLRFSFLMHQAVQRDAERVTASEIRAMIAEIEDALGGIYSVLADELQLPLVNRVLARLKKKNTIPDLKLDLFQLKITTGLQALGRNHDLQRLDFLLAGVPEPLLPGIMERINLDEYIRRRSTALGVNTDGLLKTDEQIQAEKQQAQMQQLAEKAAGPAVSAAGQITQQQLQSQQQPQQGEQ